MTQFRWLNCCDVTVTDSNRILDGRHWLGIVLIALGVSAAPLDTSVNVVFPSITEAFGRDVDSAQWIVISYVLTYSCLLLGFGRLADLIGHRRVFIFGIAWSTLALVGCSLASDFHWFLLARFAQGVGTAMLFSTGAALMTLSAPPQARTRVLVAYAFVLSASSAIGPLAGGLLVDTFGWQSVFWFRIPALMLSLVGMFWLADTGSPSQTEAQSFDWPGALALASGVLLAVLALNRLADQQTAYWSSILLVVAAVVALAYFVCHSLKVDAPILELRLFRQRTFAAANLTNVLVNSASFIVLLLGPFYLARVTNGDAAEIGPLLATYGICAALAAGVARALLERLGPVGLSELGLGFAAVGLYWISIWPETRDTTVIVGALAVHGFGYGLFQVAAVDVVMGTVPRSQQGIGGSLNTLTRTFGVVSGASLGSLAFAALGGGNAVPMATYMAAHAIMFEAASALVVVAMIVLWLITQQDRHE
jgi:EmrB/QacA subfamily drug resistance transporter